MLNDWDSLYKIIQILKKKFNDEKKDSYLSFLNIVLVDPEQKVQEMGG